MVILALFACSLLLLGCAGTPAPSQPSANGQQPPAGSNQQPAAQQTGSGTAKVKLSDEPYAQYAVLIYPGALSSGAQSALLGFTMGTTPMPDGSTQVKLTEMSTQATMSATAAAGQSVYFLEKNSGDDSEGKDAFLQDDTMVVVDSGGYVVPS